MVRIEAVDMERRRVALESELSQTGLGGVVAEVDYDLGVALVVSYDAGEVGRLPGVLQLHQLELHADELLCRIFGDACLDVVDFADLPVAVGLAVVGDPAA